MTSYLCIFPGASEEKVQMERILFHFEIYAIIYAKYIVTRNKY